MIIKRCNYCDKEMNIFPYMLKIGRGKFCSKKCSGENRIPIMLGRHHSEDTKRKIGKANSGEASSGWKGDKISYNGLHWWIRRHFGKPQLCEDCGTTIAKIFDWANISGLYSRERSDWKRLCRSCHIKFDLGGRRIYV